MDETPETRPSLMLRIRDARNQQAWSEFMEIYEPLIYRLARHWRLQDADAREVCQEVFLAVTSAIDRWDPDPARGSFRAWLFRIARNLMINFLVKQRQRPQATGASEVRELLDQQPAPAAEVSDLFDLEYKREVIRWAAEEIRDQFKESTWQAFWLTSVEGKDIKDVANALDMSVGSVYVSRSRVMARLRSRIEQLEEE